jgi:Putative Zn-dependent protease, contains TPR repeats
LNRTAAILLCIVFASAPVSGEQATDPPTNDPLLLQRRVATVLRQSTKYYEADDFQAALDRLATLQGASGQDLSVLNLRGAILAKLERYDEAREIFTAILTADPNYSPAVFNLGHVKFVAADYEGARQIFQSIPREDPSNALANFRVLLCLQALGRDAEAGKIADGLSPVGRTPAWYYAQAMIARKAGDEATARKHLGVARSIYQASGCKFFDETIETVKF